MINCHICDRNFFFRKHIESHYALVHFKRFLIEMYGVNDDKVCKVCSRNFTQKRSLFVHLVSAHNALTGKIPSKDEKVPKRATRALEKTEKVPEKATRALEKEEKVPEKPNKFAQIDAVGSGFQCHICKGVKPSYKNLVKHYSLTHFKKMLSERFIHQDKSSCSICRKECKSEKHLLFHLARVHKGLINEIPRETDSSVKCSSTVEERLVTAYKCHLCTRVLSDWSTLACHLGSAHYKSKLVEDYQVDDFGLTCSVCQSTLARPAGLFRHLISFHNALENEIPAKAELKINVPASTKRTRKIKVSKRKKKAVPDEPNEDGKGSEKTNSGTRPKEQMVT